MSVEEIAAVVAQYPTRFVVVTGGEPMIAKGMRGLLARLREAGKHITIETAGTVAPEGAAVDLELKFVIATREDLLEAQRLLATIGAPIPPEKILLMPEGTSVEAMRARYDLLIQASKDHGYRLSPRLHIEWFGNKRGT